MSELPVQGEVTVQPHTDLLRCRVLVEISGITLYVVLLVFNIEHYELFHCH